jgi:hypothetical protein
MVKLVRLWRWPALFWSQTTGAVRFFMLRNILGCVLFVVLTVVAAVGCDLKKKEQGSESSSPPAPLADVTPAMTKKSPLHKIPWPSDAAPIKGQDGAVSTQVGTVAEITAFYQKWMAANKWAFDAKYSTLDPDDGVKGGPWVHDESNLVQDHQAVHHGRHHSRKWGQHRPRQIGADNYHETVGQDELPVNRRFPPNTDPLPGRQTNV